MDSLCCRLVARCSEILGFPIARPLYMRPYTYLPHALMHLGRTVVEFVFSSVVVNNHGPNTRIITGSKAMLKAGSKGFTVGLIGQALFFTRKLSTQLLHPMYVCSLSISVIHLHLQYLFFQMLTNRCSNFLFFTRKARQHRPRAQA